MPVREPFRVLMVCTGNVCRSPMAERLLISRLAQSAGPSHDRHLDEVEVTSAGTSALVGQTMTREVAALVAQGGGNPSGHVARQLTEPLLDGVSLVLAMTREHRSAVVLLRPQLLRSTFTLLEAGRSAALLPRVEGDSLADRWRALVPLLIAARGQSPVVAAAADDVIDPFRKNAKVHARSAGQIVSAVDALVAAVA